MLLNIYFDFKLLIFVYLFVLYCNRKDICNGNMLLLCFFLLNLTDFTLTQILFTAAEISNPCQNLTQTASTVG